MRISLAVAAFASLVTLTSGANAQFADQRTFFHPLGFWSNEGFVAQRQIYPRRARYNYDDLSWELCWNSSGGGMLNERNR